MTTAHLPLTLCELTDPQLPGVESYSPFCLKIHRALRVAGLPYERRFGAHPGVHQALNPRGQVPVLLIGAEPLADSTAIAHWIDKTAPGRLTPTGQPEVSAEAWLWEEFADTALNGFLVAARWADEENWPRSREAYFTGAPAPIRPIIAGLVRRRVMGSLMARDVWRAGEAACWARLETVLDQLDARAATRTWWVGEGLTIADLAIFGQVHSLRTPLTPRQHAMVDRRPHLRAYLDRIQTATT